jgi:hypothetical protein
MSIAELVPQIVALIVPVLPELPYVSKVAVEEAEEAGKKVEDAALKRAHQIWARLHPTLRAQPGALEVAKHLAQEPQNTRAQAAFGSHVENALHIDQGLADEIEQILLADEMLDTHVPSGPEAPKIPKD